MEDIENIKKAAQYCLNCKSKPCQKGCPLGNDIPAFIEKIREEKYEEAYNILQDTTVLPAICGEICPHTKQCQGHCIRGIKGESVQIGKLEAFVGEYANKNKLKIKKLEENKNKKVAIIGSGPAGLTAATYLAQRGYKVTIYERESKPGGILSYGIPEFRLKRETIKETIEKITDLGVEIKTNTEIGKDINLADIKKDNDVIFFSIGSNVSSKMKIEGENLENVFGGNELLQKSNHPNYIGKDVAVVGGGNVAMDVARTVKRLGAKSVTVIYRREEAQMPAEEKEVEHAKKEGIQFLFKTKPIRILGDKKVEKIECIKTELVQKEEGKRPYPIDIEGSNFEIKEDYVIMAIGSRTR